MCGRYYFTRVSEDEKLNAVNKYMEKNYPGEYKTGEISMRATRHQINT